MFPKHKHRSQPPGRAQPPRAGCKSRSCVGEWGANLCSPGTSWPRLCHLCRGAGWGRAGHVPCSPAFGKSRGKLLRSVPYRYQKGCAVSSAAPLRGRTLSPRGVGRGQRGRAGCLQRQRSHGLFPGLRRGGRRAGEAAAAACIMVHSAGQSFGRAGARWRAGAGGTPCLLPSSGLLARRVLSV